MINDVNDVSNETNSFVIVKEQTKTSRPILF
jgi:hypothetical protein